MCSPQKLFLLVFLIFLIKKNEFFFSIEFKVVKECGIWHNKKFHKIILLNEYIILIKKANFKNTKERLKYIYLFYAFRLLDISTFEFLLCR